MKDAIFPDLSYANLPNCLIEIERINLVQLYRKQRVVETSLHNPCLRAIDYSFDPRRLRWVVVGWGGVECTECRMNCKSLIVRLECKPFTQYSLASLNIPAAHLYANWRLR